MTLEEESLLSCYRKVAGSGGSGSAEIVQHTGNGRIFIRKILTVYDAGVYRYLREHPVRHTPRIYEAVEDEGHLIVIEEYISGPTLKELLKKHGPMPESMVYQIMEELCGILADLHGAGPPIIHRDIKPSNIILTPDGSIRLLDMNAAKRVSGSGSEDTNLIGTVGYAAPEQYGFAASDARTDIYAAGVLMNVLLTGAFPKDRPAGGRAGEIIGKCTHIESSARFADARELADALAAARGGGGPAERTAPGRRWARFLPPGFRSLNPFIMLFAAGIYIMLADVCAGAGRNMERPIERRLYPIAALIIVFGCILVSGNYLNVLDRLGIVRKGNGRRELAMYILKIAAADVLIFLLGTMWLAILLNIG